jgi:hypothetical protein
MSGRRDELSPVNEGISRGNRLLVSSQRCITVLRFIKHRAWGKGHRVKKVLPCCGAAVLLFIELLGFIEFIGFIEFVGFIELRRTE